MFSIPTLLQAYHSEKLPFQLGECLGNGNQGYVYSDLDNSEQVIKLSILVDDFGPITLNDRFDNIRKTYRHIIDNPHSSIVKISKFDQLSKGSEFIFEWEQCWIIYYSIMEKLNPLSEDECKVFKTICDAFNGEVKIERTVEIIVKEQKEWLKFDDEKILNFYKSLSDLKIDHKDFEPRNIMKDKDNNIKLIDFDLSKMQEKENVKN